MTERRETGRGRGTKPAHRKPNTNRNTRKAHVSPEDDWSQGERIAKYLARCGIASRRGCEALIIDGKVSVDGLKLTSPAFKVTGRETIRVDRKIVSSPEPARLWRYHKPAGLLTTNTDPEGRRTIYDELPKSLPRTVTIGRLDLNTEGLLLLTNDGELARAMELPKNAFTRKYRARAYGHVDQEMLDTLMQGVTVQGTRYGAIKATLDQKTGTNSWIHVELTEGKKREVRFALEALDLKVNRLIRTDYGPFSLDDLKPGKVVEIDPATLMEELGEMIPEARRPDLTERKPRPASRVGRTPRSGHPRPRKKDAPKPE